MCARVVSCNKCGKCCCGKMGPLIFPRDIKPICTNLKISYKDFLCNYCEKHNFDENLNKIYIYYLKMSNDRCIFLDKNHLCKIYHSRPYQCVYAPFNFLAKYEYWKHMTCITEDDFLKVSSEMSDKIVFSSILNGEYVEYEEVI